MASLKPILFSKTEPCDFQVHVPRANAGSRKQSMSAFAVKKTRVQLGANCTDPYNMGCVFEKVVSTGPTKAVAIRLVDADLRDWFCDYEASMVALLHRNCVEWFGKEMDLSQARRMIASILRRDVLTVKCAKYVDVYKLDGDDGCSRMELTDVPANSFCTPIVQFDGLFIAKHHFSCSFTVTAMLVGDVQSTREEALSQFVREEERDLDDPQTYLSDEASGHSFDTMKHDEFMSTFESAFDV